MKFKITLVIKGEERLLKDLNSGFFQQGVIDDLLEREEKMLNFNYEEIKL